MRAIGVAALVSAAMLASGCAAGPPRATLAGGDSGRIAFESRTFPTTSLLSLERDGTPTIVSGELRLPDGAGPFPAVILLHGAGGPGANPPPGGAPLNRAGIAGFIVDSFGPRGIVETRTGTVRLNVSSRVVDAYRALALLATHPRIDRDRIALMGFSAGGGIVLLARQARLRELWMVGDRSFVAFLALYPSGCNARLLGDEAASTGPLRIFHGTADDQTIIEPCREHVARMRAAGHDAALVEYAGAHHAFDARAPRRFEADVISGRNCAYVERTPGTFDVSYRDTGKPVPPNASCISRGITLGHDPRAHRQVVQDVKSALAAVFSRGR